MNNKERALEWMRSNAGIEYSHAGDIADQMIEAGLSGKRNSLRRYVLDHLETLGWDASREDASTEEGEMEEVVSPLQDANQNYFYREELDLYLVFLPHRPKAVQIKGEDVRAMKESYSNWTGETHSINEIARSMGVSRKDFKAIKTLFGWTHDSSPYPDEVLVSASHDELVEDLARKRERDLEIENREREWKRNVDDAKKWREHKARIANHERPDLMAYAEARGPREQVHLIGGMPRKYAVIPRYSDVHYGKLGTSGHGKTQTRATVIAHTERTIQDVAAFGLPERVILTLGDDFCHIDNSQGTTTRGTPQDVDGLPADVLYGAMDLQVEVVDRWRSLGCPIEVHVVLSNHGRWTDLALAKALQIAYRNTDAVEVHLPKRSRHYLTYGKCLIGLAHGDRLKLTNASTLMANEASHLWSDHPHRYFLTGDKHHDREVDVGGVLTCQAPSPSHDDRWHEHEGYVTSRPGFVTYLMDAERGRILTLHGVL